MDEYGEKVELTDAEQIPAFLTGEEAYLSLTPDAVVWIDGVAICKIVKGKFESIACDHPRHGCHPRFREAYEKARGLMKKLRGTGFIEESGEDDLPCPKCGGGGWLSVDSDEARHVVMLSLMMGMWRGVAFTPQGLSAGDLGDTMNAFLPGLMSAGSSSSPVGVAASDRAFFTQSTGKAKTKEKIDE